MNIELSTISSADLPGLVTKLSWLTDTLAYKIAEVEIARCVHFVHFTPLVEQQILFAQHAREALGDRLDFLVQLIEKGGNGINEAMKLVTQPVSVEELDGTVVFSSLVELAYKVESLITQPFFHRTISWF